MTDEEYAAETARLANELMALKRRRHGVADDANTEWVQPLVLPFWENLVIAYTGTERDVAERAEANGVD
jgi:hypothetical protein